MRRVLVMVMVAAGLLTAACTSSSDSAKSSSSSTPSGSSTPAAASGAAASGSTASGSATVNVATDAKYGQILVGPSGKTLYLFASDSGTTSACKGGCASVWPALTAAGTPQGGPGVEASKLGVADGQVAGQVTYNGHLLYSFSGDSKAGDVNGAAIPNWFPVSPAGDKASSS